MTSAAEHHASLAQTRVRLEILDGLDHAQEFSDVARVLPAAVKFSLQ